MTINEVDIEQSIGFIETDMDLPGDFINHWSPAEPDSSVNYRILDGVDTREFSRRLIKDSGREVSIRLRWGSLPTNKSEKSLSVMDVTGGGMGMIFNSDANIVASDPDLIEAIIAALKFNEDVFLVRMNDDEFLDIVYFLRRQLRFIKRSQE